MHIHTELLLKALNALRPCSCRLCLKTPRRSYHRLPVIAAGLLVIVPLTAISMTASLMDKYRTTEELDFVMDAAGAAESSGKGLPYEKSIAEKRLKEVLIVLEDAEQHKAQARRKLVEAKREIEKLHGLYGIDATDTGSVLAMVGKETERIVSFLQYLRGKTLIVAAGGPDLGIALTRSLLYTSLGEITDIGIRAQALERARLRIFEVALTAMELGEKLPMLNEEYEKEIDAYQKAWDAYVEARQGVTDAEARIEEVKRITEEVQREIRSLQREL